MSQWINPDDIRADFSAAMSKMYQQEVPLYGDLMDLVADVNTATLKAHPELQHQLEQTGEIERLDMERHGAIRVGKPEELATIRRVFAVMGMQPVGYYDLAPAGVPVHSTAFRATDAKSLNRSPFRVFTSLLRLELIDDPALRQQAEETLAKRNIFTDGAIALTEQCERDGGLNETDAKRFVEEVLETFRWHTESPVSRELYQALHDQHRLIADVVAFKGPHINHLTPRTLDIDAVQAGMSSRGITPKAVIEGPPRRNCPILLRQTSFKALEESVTFTGSGQPETGHHTARFGEIEQRGVALTPKGRGLYDRLLNEARGQLGGAPNEANADRYMQLLEASFSDFPDDYATLRSEELAYFHYFVTEQGKARNYDKTLTEADLDTLLTAGDISIEPIVYEDFLPVSAAGIFQSNLGEGGAKEYNGTSNRDLFERDLGASVQDELELYATTERQSIATCLAALNQN
ncbi:VOC family protein [Cardiobacteriaceae bacterium TAE3-ERU3]|nr:VOC family protein [Cardiobacteriaceae bacterium TAE3-ERU3]